MAAVLPVPRPVTPRKVRSTKLPPLPSIPTLPASSRCSGWSDKGQNQTSTDLISVKVIRWSILLTGTMVRTILYRCPITGMNSQGHADRDEGPTDPSLYKPLVCLSCGRVHPVSPHTGKLLSDADDFKRRQVPSVRQEPERCT